jgi:hypothetical protein
MVQYMVTISIPALNKVKNGRKVERKAPFLPCSVITFVDATEHFPEYYGRSTIKVPRILILNDFSTEEYTPIL